MCHLPNMGFHSFRSQQYVSDYHVLSKLNTMEVDHTGGYLSSVGCHYPDTPQKYGVVDISRNVNQVFLDKAEQTKILSIFNKQNFCKYKIFLKLYLHLKKSMHILPLFFKFVF